ncbi:MAG: flagellin [Desulfovibrionaceae bacterium]
MALTDLEKNFIYEYTSQLLTQDILTNSLFANSGVGRSLRDLVLAKQEVQPLTYPTEAALTGTMRADSAAVRQNSANVSEAANMMGIAASAMQQIADSLTAMEDIIDQINAGELSASSSVVQADYNALRDKITGIIGGTDYNGIYMLDGSQWGTDQIDASGNVYIQAFKNGGFNITFHNLDGITWSNLDGADLAAADTRATQLSYVQDFASQVDTILDLYTNKQTALESQAAQLSSQADLLDQAVASRSPRTASLTTEQLLLNLLLSDTGTIVDSSG